LLMTVAGRMKNSRTDLPGKFLSIKNYWVLIIATKTFSNLDSNWLLTSFDLFYIWPTGFKSYDLGTEWRTHKEWATPINVAFQEIVSYMHQKSWIDVTELVDVKNTRTQVHLLNQKERT
jgi:hypothetical protein